MVTALFPGKGSHLITVRVIPNLRITPIGFKCIGKEAFHDFALLKHISGATATVHGEFLVEKMHVQPSKIE